jgi:hypothetical protein
LRPSAARRLSRQEHPYWGQYGFANEVFEENDSWGASSSDTCHCSYKYDEFTCHELPGLPSRVPW